LCLLPARSPLFSFPGTGGPFSSFLFPPLFHFLLLPIMGCLGDRRVPFPTFPSNILILMIWRSFFGQELWVRPSFSLTILVLLPFLSSSSSCRDLRLPSGIFHLCRSSLPHFLESFPSSFDPSFFSPHTAPVRTISPAPILNVMY